MNIFSNAIIEMQGYPKTKSDSFSDTILANFNNHSLMKIALVRLLDRLINCFF